MNTKFIFQSLMLIFLSVITLFCSRNPPSTPTPIPGEIYVNDFGATPNDTTDDTNAFQRAINAVDSLGGGTVKARPGVYLINPDVSIQMKSNVTLDLEDQNRVLQAKTSPLHRYEIIQVWDAINVTIKGGLIIGDLMTHVYNDSCRSAGQCEQGFGIDIRRSQNTRVQGSHIKHCWGDGIVVAGNKISYSINTIIDQVVCDSNRRQGLTIGGGASGVTVTKSHFTNTGQYRGTKPMDGIDIEPDCNKAENIKILDCIFARNGELCVEKRGANGIEMNAIQTEERKVRCDSARQNMAMIRNVEIRGCRITTSNYPVYIQNSSLVTVHENTFDSTRFGLYKVNCDGCVDTANIRKNPYTCNTTQ